MCQVEFVSCLKVFPVMMSLPLYLKRMIVELVGGLECVDPVS